MKKAPAAINKIPILDLHLAAFMKLHGNSPELEVQGDRVIFLFNANEVFYRLSAKYNSNQDVAILDYVNALRQLKSMMLSMKGPRR